MVIDSITQNILLKKFNHDKVERVTRDNDRDRKREKRGEGSDKGSEVYRLLLNFELSCCLKCNCLNFTQLLMTLM